MTHLRFPRRPFSAAERRLVFELPPDVFTLNPETAREAPLTPDGLDAARARALGSTERVVSSPAFQATVGADPGALEPVLADLSRTSGNNFFTSPDGTYRMAPYGSGYHRVPTRGPGGGGNFFTSPGGTYQYRPGASTAPLPYPPSPRMYVPTWAPANRPHPSFGGVPHDFAQRPTYPGYIPPTGRGNIFNGGFAYRYSPRPSGFIPTHYAPRPNVPNSWTIAPGYPRPAPYAPGLAAARYPYVPNYPGITHPHAYPRARWVPGVGLVSSVPTGTPPHLRRHFPGPVLHPAPTFPRTVNHLPPGGSEYFFFNQGNSRFFYWHDSIGNYHLRATNDLLPYLTAPAPVTTPVVPPYVVEPTVPTVAPHSLEGMVREINVILALAERASINTRQTDPLYPVIQQIRIEGVRIRQNLLTGAYATPAHAEADIRVLFGLAQQLELRGRYPGGSPLSSPTPALGLRGRPVPRERRLPTRVEATRPAVPPGRPGTLVPPVEDTVPAVPPGGPVLRRDLSASLGQGRFSFGLGASQDMEIRLNSVPHRVAASALPRTAGAVLHDPRGFSIVRLPGEENAYVVHFFVPGQHTISVSAAGDVQPLPRDAVPIVPRLEPTRPAVPPAPTPVVELPVGTAPDEATVPVLPPGGPPLPA